MDPTANAKEQLVLAKKMVADYDNVDGNGIDQDDANRLAELVLALDGWLKSAGVTPKKRSR